SCCTRYSDKLHPFPTRRSSDLEQARGLQVDARTDVFSLGVLIYEMVAGRLPFEGSNINEIVASILSDKEPSPLVRYARGVPAELDRKSTRLNSSHEWISYAVFC